MVPPAIGDADCSGCCCAYDFIELNCIGEDNTDRDRRIDTDMTIIMVVKLLSNGRFLDNTILIIALKTFFNTHHMIICSYYCLILALYF